MSFDINEFMKASDVQAKKRFIENLHSDALEGYFIYRGPDNMLHMHSVERMLFDRDLTIGDRHSIDAHVSISLYNDETCISRCQELVTEYKQIKEYEDKISELEQKLEKTTNELNFWCSKSIHYRNAIKGLEDEKRAIEAMQHKSWFVLFVDQHTSPGTCESIIQIPLSREDEFFKSDYWTRLFTKNPIFSEANIYEPPNVTYDRWGCNHWFVVCDSKSRDSAIQHLRYYHDTPYKVLHGVEEYMYRRLNEIWKLTFGEEHKS